MFSLLGLSLVICGWRLVEASRSAGPLWNKAGNPGSKKHHWTHWMSHNFSWLLGRIPFMSGWSLGGFGAAKTLHDMFNFVLQQQTKCPRLKHRYYKVSWWFCNTHWWLNLNFLLLKLIPLNNCKTVVCISAALKAGCHSKYFTGSLLTY